MTAYIRSESEPEMTTTSHNTNSSIENDRSAVTVNIITTQEEFDNLESAWNGLLDKPEVEAHIFQTFEWQRLWWKNFGEDNDLQIFTVWNDHELVGLAPCFIEKNSLMGLYEFKKLKFIGSSVSDKNSAATTFTDNTFSYYLDLIIQPDYQEEVVNEFIRFMVQSRKSVDSIQIDEISEESTMLNEVLLKIWQYGWQFDGDLKEASTQIMVSDEAEDKLQSGENQGLRQYTESENLFRICRVQDKKELDSAFDNFVGLHKKQWSEQGYPGIFADRKLENFFGEVTKSLAEKGSVRMSLVFDSTDTCVAVNLAFQFRDRIYSYQNAFEAEDAIPLITDSLIQDAVNNGMACIDLLKNEENVQGRHANHTRNLKVTIPGYSSKNSVKDFLHRVVQTTTKMKEQLAKEWMLLKKYVNQWGRTLVNTSG